MSQIRNTFQPRRCRRIALSGLALALALSSFTGRAQQRTNRPPTRLEFLRGTLTPIRTCYDVTRYDLDIRIDPATQSIGGSNKITFKTVTDFQKMQIDLFSNMVISGIVFDEGKTARFTRELNAVYVELPETVKKGSRHSITVAYSGKPIVARNPPWTGGFTWTNDADGNPWVVDTCQGTGASLWWPCKEHQSDEPDDGMTIAVTVPPGLEDVSNGRLKSRTLQSDGWTRFEWVISYPINNYDVAINVGKYAHWSDEYVYPDGEKLTLDYYVEPENLAKAKKQFLQAKMMLTAYDKYFGKYPFIRDGFKLIECPHTGMEHQTAVAYGNRYGNGYRGRASSAVGMEFDFIIVHECAHEWWGNNVTAKDPADMWIHESFGAYAESLFVEYHYGHQEALNYINGKRRSVRNDRPIIGEYGLNREGSPDMYDKGQLVLNTLRSVINDDDKWFSILRGLQDKFALQTVTAEDIFGYINKKSGKDLSYFFDQYFRHAALPRLMVETQKDGDKVSARYRWQADAANFKMPIQVLTSPGKYEFITPTAQWQTVQLHGLQPEEFKVAQDLYLVDVRLNRPEVAATGDKK
jgi:aminopeptidase N